MHLHSKGLSVKTTYFWNQETTPAEINSMLNALSEEYPLTSAPDEQGTELLICMDPVCTAAETSVNKDQVSIRCATLVQAARAVGNLLSGLEPVVEKNDFKTLGIMLDCSRNGVMRPDHLKKWLRRLALLGYNMVMLYTEDTYEIKDIPEFGYMRGRYSIEELQEIDRYASMLGIEIIGCIQTLGHMEQTLRWHEFGKYKDTDQVLLAGSDDTYEMIESMIVSIKTALNTSRIHIGMDEAWDLGRGMYIDKFGYREENDIFCDHLNRVVAIAEKHGMKPMIWSDMFFRIASSSGNYYDTDCTISQSVKDKIPENVELVYWDYYAQDSSHYEQMTDRHLELSGRIPVMASGVWTWGIPWYWHSQTARNALPCIDACRSKGIDELFFTLWGDDGAYCDFDSALAGLTLCSEKSYSLELNEDAVRAKFNALFDSDYDAIFRAAEMNDHLKTGMILWDDPLQAIYMNTASDTQLKAAADGYTAIANDLDSQKVPAGSGDIAHATQLCRCAAMKLRLRLNLVAAYKTNDRNCLNRLMHDADETASALNDLMESFRRNWMRRNKPQGLEVIQIRLSGNITRFRELKRRIEEYLGGLAETIPELEEIQDRNPLGTRPRYKNFATGSCAL